jgi:uncharacterized phage infection (PIP) family protein YhgE
MLWQRILAVTGMVLSVLLIILLVVGIVGTWTLNRTLTDSAVRVLTGFDAVLGNTQSALSELDTAVGGARQRLDAFDETVATAAANLEDPILLAAIGDRLDLGIAPAVEEVRSTVQSIRETVLVAQNTMQTLNTLPFVSIGSSVADDGTLQSLAGSVTSLVEGVREIRDGVRAARDGAITGVVTRLGQGTSRMDAELASIETAVSGADARASTLRAQVSDLKSALTFWLDAMSLLVTLAMIWLIFSQVVTFVLGLSAYKGENLFARWLGARWPGSPPQ